MEESSINKIKSLIAEDELLEAISAFISFTEEKSFKNEAVRIKGQINEWEKAKRKGVLSIDQLDLKINRIRDGILSLLDGKMPVRYGANYPSESDQTYQPIHDPEDLDPYIKINYSTKRTLEFIFIGAICGAISTIGIGFIFLGISQSIPEAIVLGAVFVLVGLLGRVSRNNRQLEIISLEKFKAKLEKKPSGTRAKEIDRAIMEITGKRGLI